MAIENYIPNQTDVVHPTRVDLVNRNIIPETIHIVQYDETLPIIAVELFKNGEIYNIPNDSDIKIRWPKTKYSEAVYKNVIGKNGNTVYFAVGKNMSADFGDIVATLEITVNETFTDTDGLVYDKRMGATSPIYISIDRNPIQKSDLNYPIPSHEFPEDGVYVLEATVVNGVATYNWILKSNNR